MPLNPHYLLQTHATMNPLTESCPTRQALIDEFDWAHRLAVAMVRDANLADDLVQEAYRIGMERPPSRPEKARAWLAQVIRNNVRGHFRSSLRRRKREEKVMRDIAHETDPIKPMEKSESMDLVSTTVLGLPEPYRTTLLLHYWEKRFLKEISVEMETPLRTVESRLRKGRDLIKERIDQDLGGKDSWVAAMAPLLIPEGPKPLVPPIMGAGLAALALIAGGVAYSRWSGDETVEKEPVPVVVEADREVPSDPPVEGTPILEREDVSPPPMPKEAALPVAESVRIRVVEMGTGAPLAGIEAEILQMAVESGHGATEPPQFGSRTWMELERGNWISDEEGWLEVEVHPESSRLQVAPSLYSPSHSLRHLTAPNRRRTEKKNGKWRDLVLEMVPRHGSVTGICTTSTGILPKGSQVQYWQGNRTTPFRSAESDIALQPGGFFHMDNVLSQVRGFTIAAQAPGWISPLVFRGWPKQGPHFEDVELLLERTYPRTIQVLGHLGLPAAGVEVRVESRDSAPQPPFVEGGSYARREWEARYTDEDGRVTFENLPNGMTAIASLPGTCPTTAKIPDGPSYLEIRMQIGIPLVGTVRDPDGMPVPNASLSVFSSGCESNAVSDSHGSFRLPSVDAEGTFRVRVECEGYAVWVSPRMTAVDVQTMEIQLQPGLKASGMVVPMPNPDHLLRRPMALVPLKTELPSGQRGDSWLPIFTAKLDSEGHFLFEDLPAGEYLLTCTFRDGTIWSRQCRAGQTGIELTPSDDAELKVHPVRVVDAHGHGVADVQVMTMPMIHSTFPRSCQLMMPNSTASTDEKGYAGLSKLLEGPFSLCIWHPTSHKHVHRTVHFPVDMLDDLQIVLPEMRSTRLRILDDQDLPVHGARASMYDQDGYPHPFLPGNLPSRVLTMRTDEEGWVQLPGMPYGLGMELEVTWEDDSGITQVRSFEVDSLPSEQ